MTTIGQPSGRPDEPKVCEVDVQLPVNVRLRYRHTDSGLFYLETIVLDHETEPFDKHTLQLAACPKLTGCAIKELERLNRSGAL